MLNPLSASDSTPAPAAVSAPAVASNPFGALLVDMRLHSRLAPAPVAQTSAPEPRLQSIAPPSSVALLQPESVSPAPDADRQTPPPPPRPAEFRQPASHGGSLQARAPGLVGPQSGKAAPAPAAAQPDSRSLFEKVFGALETPEAKPSRSALAYAAPESDILDRARRIIPGPQFGYDRETAVYDISAHTVYLPDGTKLEAHSGLGDKLDDPRYVHVRMRGATPPHVYELSLRERLFHGVQALRLTPVGDGNVFGRSGLLAHTYMLGPRGDSNGCVAFKNYDAFLRAFQSGEIKRLVVVERRG